MIRLPKKENTTYNVRIVSEKGGVGKTTISVNLAMELAMRGYKVLLGDADLVNPSVLYYLDLGNFRFGSNDVYSGLVTQKEATVRYGRTNMYVIPARPTYRPALPTSAQLNRAYKLLKREEEKIKYDFLITDTPPGFNPNPSLAFYGDMMIIMNPSLPSAMSAIKMSRLLASRNISHLLVCNRLKRTSAEMGTIEIERAYGSKISVCIPEDPIVEEALHERTPAVAIFPDSNFSVAIKKLADVVISRSGKGKKKGGRK